MTRINTNVSSLVAQNTLGRSNAALEQALTRLSTGLRINTGKDDPAGLIASENLRSDITSIKRAIGNTDRANQVIATADSALGQVSGLLNDIRGLVTEAANTGALSDDQIAANQLQIDSSLEALNRIAQTTTFQGRRLLDGSLDFITTAGSGFSTVTDLKIDQANLGSTGSVAVAVNITSAATQAQITNTAVPASSAGSPASGTLTFADTATAAAGTVNFTLAEQQATGTVTLTTTTTAATFTLTALSGQAAAGSEGNGVKNITIAQGAAGAVYNAGTNTLAVTVDIAGGDDTVDDVIAAIDLGGDFNATILTNGTNVIDATDTGSGTLAGGQDAQAASISVLATAGSAGNISISFAEAAAIGATPAVVDNGGGSYTIQVDNTVETTLSAIETAIETITEVASATASNGALTYAPTLDSVPSTTNLIGGNNAGNDVITISADVEGTTANGITVTVQELTGQGATPSAAFLGNNIVVTVDDTATTTISSIANSINNLVGYSASVTLTAGDGNYIGSSNAPPTAATLAGGATGTGGLDDDIVLEVSGATGAEVLSFSQGTSLAQIVSAVTAVSDATGVSASTSSGNLVLTSTAFGSDAFVSVKVLDGDDNSTFEDGLSDDRDEGTDVAATVNGIQASGRGNTLSINTATLDLQLTVSAGSSTDVNFTISGGGALFQLGPDVVSNQQARIGITSVNTARLGGVSGKLFQLGTGGTSDLASDPTSAALIVEDAINQITSLRGRLGAFQRTSLETNREALNDTLVNLTEAESQIRDADFAAETAALTRSQILVQSGTVVLQISNQNPQNVLALLQ